jgi:hypothetical protein
LSDPITARARALILRDIHSVEQLEVLLLLRAAPDKVWTAKDVARAVVSTPETAEIRLRDLEQRRLIERRGEGWVYAPTRDVADAVGDLAHAYATHRFTVVELIFSKPSDAVLGFSDAFRVRRKD